MRRLILFTLVLFGPRSPAEDRLNGLLSCVQQLRSNDLGIRPDARSLVVAYPDQPGWSLRVFDGDRSLRCDVPAAVLTCFKLNSQCRAFDFVVARPERRGGLGITFDGSDIGDTTRTSRLAPDFRRYDRGTVEGDGRIARTIVKPKNPTLGLKCVPDRDPKVLAEVERRVIRAIGGLNAQFLANTPKADQNWVHAQATLATLDLCARTPSLANPSHDERRKFLKLPGAPNADSPPPSGTTTGR